MLIIKRVLLPVTVLTIAQCAQKTDCRKYAEQIVASTGARIDCSFNENKAEKRCVSGGVTSVYAYRSLGDFIAESHATGRRLWAGLEVTGSTNLRVLVGFSDDRRILSTVQLQGASVWTNSTLEWDTNQRPTIFTSNFDTGSGATCSGRIQTAQFDDATGTVTVSNDYTQSVGSGALAGTPCAGASNYSVVYRYDGDNDLIAEDSITYSILRKGEVCQ